MKNIEKKYISSRAFDCLSSRQDRLAYNELSANRLKSRKTTLANLSRGSEGATYPKDTLETGLVCKIKPKKSYDRDDRDDLWGKSCGNCADCKLRGSKKHAVQKKFSDMFKPIVLKLKKGRRF